MYPFDKPLENESGKAFKAFCIYRDLGDGRTLEQAFRKGHRNKYGNDTEKRLSRSWEKWSSTYHWVERVKAYDAYLIEKVRQEEEKQLIKELKEMRGELGTTSRMLLNTSKLTLLRYMKRVQGMTEEEIQNIPLSVMSSLLRASADGIEKATDGWGMALGLDDLMDMLESEDGE